MLLSSLTNTKFQFLFRHWLSVILSTALRVYRVYCTREIDDTFFCLPHHFNLKYSMPSIAICSPDSFQQKIDIVIFDRRFGAHTLPRKCEKGGLQNDGLKFGPFCIEWHISPFFKAAAMRGMGYVT